MGPTPPLTTALATDHAGTALVPSLSRDALWAKPRTVAVVGLSPRPERDSHEVARYLQAHGWRIVPVNPAAGTATILGEPVHPDLTSAAQAASAAGTPIELVNCFRHSEEIPAIVDDAIAIGARGVWTQYGIRHDAAADKARAAGLLVVQDQCLMVEHRRAARA